MTMIEANSALINSGFSRIMDNLYIKGDIHFRLTLNTIKNLPI